MNDTPVIPSPAFFAEECCRNCGAKVSTPFCSACGQKRAERLGWSAVRSEAWDKVRLYENSVVKSALLTVLQPGKVAREYVLGARKKHQHPLKLLLLAIGILVLVIFETNYFDTSNPNVGRAVQIIRTYSQWSFSLGIIAIVFASLVVFRRRGHMNVIEHIALGLYTHFVIIVFNIINLAPLLLFKSPEWVAWHKQVAPYYKDWVEAAIVGYAYWQFFEIKIRREWWLLLLATAIFYATKKALLYCYARILVELVVEGYIT